MNICRGCGLDFASVQAFDAHRVGTHAYSYDQGLQATRPRRDGRRCLDPAELLERGWQQNRWGRWAPDSGNRPAPQAESVTPPRPAIRPSSRADDDPEGSSNPGIR